MLQQAVKKLIPGYLDVQLWLMVMLCDQRNKMLKLLDDVSVLTSSLKLSVDPWSAAAVDNNNVIVTTPKIKQLHYVQVFPQIKVVRVIQPDKTCWGVELSGNEIYITCQDFFINALLPVWLDYHVIDLAIQRWWHEISKRYVLWLRRQPAGMWLSIAQHKSDYSSMAHYWHLMG